MMVEETVWEDHETCDHSYDERCHTTYTTTYSTVQVLVRIVFINVALDKKKITWHTQAISEARKGAILSPELICIGSFLLKDKQNCL